MSNHRGYVVLDFETTGFNAAGKDRVVEVALVLLSAEFEIESVFTSLVNPKRDLGASHIHQIQASWILDAPVFGEILFDLNSFLAGRVLVAHNASFDLAFLVEEFKRAGHKLEITDDNYACTLQLSKWAVPEAPNRKLGTLLSLLGINNVQAHSALGDALATAEMLRRFVHLEPKLRAIFDTLEGLPDLGLVLQRSNVAPKARPEARELEENSFIARLVSRLAVSGSSPAIDEYFDLLGSALLDSDLSEQEIRDLVACAETLDLGVKDVAQAHQLYFQALATKAWEDGVLSESEVLEIEKIAALLGIGSLEIEQVKQGNFNRVEVKMNSANPFSSATLVALTGSMTPSKGEISQMLSAKGLSPVDSLSKKVSVLIAADTDSLSGKAANARKWGIPIVAAGSVAKLLESL